MSCTIILYFAWLNRKQGIFMLVIICDPILFMYICVRDIENYIYIL